MRPTVNIRREILNRVPESNSNIEYSLEGLPGSQPARQALGSELQFFPVVRSAASFVASGDEAEEAYEEDERYTHKDVREALRVHHEFVQGMEFHFFTPL